MNNVKFGKILPQIVSPVCTIDELKNAVDIGADEIYCGIIPPLIGEQYGYDDIISRRQGHIANITTPSDIKSIVAEAARKRIPIALTLNCYYSKSILPDIIRIADFWAESGGTAILLSDIALLKALTLKGLPLKYHLSIMAGAFNTATIDFYAELGVHRVVLPRELSVSEIALITSSHPTLEFEALVLHDRCPFIDGLCGFYHGTAFINGAATSERWTESIQNEERCIFSSNLSYTGHGCDILLDSADTQHVQYHERAFQQNPPACAACQLSKLVDAGIGFLKIAGRGLPAPDKALSLRFIKSAINIWQSEVDNLIAETRIKHLYKLTFNKLCNDDQCYYQIGL